MEDRTKRRARLILILGVLIAFMAALGAFVTFSGAQGGAPAQAIPTTPVVVAARDLPVRTALTAADVKVAQFNQGTEPLGALTDPKDVVGKILTVPIGLGEAVLPTKFAQPNTQPWTVFPPGVSVSPSQPLPPNTPNYRALSISVSDQNAVGGALQAGDLVDILLTFNFDPLKYLKTGNPDRTADFSSKVILQSVPILARQGATYTIRTDIETAERLAYLAASGGQIQMILRAPGDQRAPATTGATFQNIFDQFKPKIPEKFTAP